MHRDIPKIPAGEIYYDKKHREEFINAVYTSVWDDGTELDSTCVLELINRRVYNIEDSDDDSDHGVLIDEYVEYFDGKETIRLEQKDLLFDYKEDHE